MFASPEHASPLVFDPKGSGVGLVQFRQLRLHVENGLAEKAPSGLRNEGSAAGFTAEGQKDFRIT